MRKEIRVRQTRFFQEKQEVATAYVTRYVCELLIDNPNRGLISLDAQAKVVRTPVGRRTPTEAYDDAIKAAFDLIEGD